MRLVNSISKGKRRVYDIEVDEVHNFYANGLNVHNCATDGGVSVIKDDGTVVDLTLNSAAWSLSAFVTIDNAYVTFGTGSGNADSAVVWRVAMPSADQSWYEWEQDNGAYLRPLLTRNSASGAVVPRFLNLGSVSSVARETFGSSYGLTTMVVDNADHRDSLHSYITSTYNSGYMTGDIKGAWLSDTDTTNVVGTELVTNGTFDTDTSGWTTQDSSLSVSSSKLLITGSGGGGGYGGAWQILNCVIGQQYVLTWDYTAGTNNSYVDISGGTGTGVNTNFGGTGSYSISFTATSATPTLKMYVDGTGAGATGYYDNISVKLADADRSVNANGLQVNGTITKTAVATGADLVAYSGFSSANYLEQPYNSDLAFGTGDFSISIWLKQNANTTYEEVINISRYDPGFIGGGTILFEVQPNGTLNFICSDDGNTTNDTAVSPVIDNGVWTHLVGTVTSSAVTLYTNGVPSSVPRVNSTSSLSNSSATLNVGSLYQGAYPNTNGSLALARVSATAPTAAQIKEIYEAEKPLFQENAKCTLNGTSDAVQCLAYDDSTELLHVGTSGGRSTFQGLRRVDETATNTTEISAQGGMIIEETA